jgi:thioredoxin 1
LTGFAFEVQNKSKYEGFVFNITWARVMSSVTIITDAEFSAEVLQAQQPVLVYFWAAWCGPCRLMAPMMETMAVDYGDRLKVIKMEIDPNPASVKTYKVYGVPAFRLFQAGEMVASLEGAIPKQQVQAFLTDHMPALA